MVGGEEDVKICAWWAWQHKASPIPLAGLHMGRGCRIFPPFGTALQLTPPSVKLSTPSQIKCFWGGVGRMLTTALSKIPGRVESMTEAVPISTGWASTELSQLPF